MNKRLSKKKSGDELRLERETRLMNAIRLKPNDRVPIACPVGYFPAKYTGIPFSSAYYDYKAWYNAVKVTLEIFQPDYIFIMGYSPGSILEILEPKSERWPGYNLSPNSSHQVIEVDYLKSDEYDYWLQDPSDFMFRVFLPRTSDNLKGLSKFPRFWELAHGPVPYMVMAEAASNPETEKALMTLVKAGREIRKWRSRRMKFLKMISDIGYPQYTNGGALPPFDILSHSLRGMNGTTFDLFRQPDKVIEACEFILKKTLELPVPPPNEYGNLRYFMTVTRGSDDFLSKKQFEIFYLPTFKKILNAFIAKGITPCIFFEGNCNSRMEYLLDYPKGSILARLDNTDINLAYSILKGHTCIEGGIPSSLLQMGSVQDVKDCCKKLIDTVGKDGGFIIGTRTATDQAKPENLKTMIEFSKEYGRYS